MAGLMNNTARQYNLKCIGIVGKKKLKHRVTVRIAPGFNVVDDAHWKHFIEPKVDPYVADLKKKGLIDFGAAMDDLELERDPDTKAKSKSAPPPTPKKEDKS